MQRHTYRPDIDGLRAIAVGLVLAFHAFPQVVSAGFVGVDVFFVISGYLISSIVSENLSGNFFSFAGFYARRIRRIFPALIVVLLACAGVGFWVLLPAEQMSLGWQIVAGVIFMSNVMLWDAFGYFAPGIDTLPLMHLWSLSIEEQFYVAWPLLLALGVRWARWPWLLLFLVLSSFLFNVYSVYGDGLAAFYSPLARCWELAAGGLLASVSLPGRMRMVGNGVSVAGALLLLAALLLIDKEKYFPGWWALLPVVGTVLLIAAGPKAWLNAKLLSHRYVVAVGLISYPLYLWHWPLLSFARILEEATPSVGIRITALLLSMLFAWLTWRFVEQPVQAAPRNRMLICCLCAAMAFVALSGYGLVWRSQRVMDDNAVQQVLPEDIGWEGWQKCHGTRDCRMLDVKRPADIAVIGDSHAGHLAPGLADIVSARGENVAIWQSPMCLPLLAPEALAERHADVLGCNAKRLHEALQSASIKTIILSGYANLFIHKYPEGMPGNPNLRELSNDVAAQANAVNVQAFARALQFTLEQMEQSGKRIVFVVDNPELDFEPRECVSLRPVTLPGHTLRSPCAVARAKHEAWSADYLRMVADAQVKFPSVIFIYADRYFCDEELCRAMIDNELMYSDRHHLSPAGSRYFMRQVADRILP